MPLVLNGATSGSTTIQATDATTQTITLPANSGTVLTSLSTQSQFPANIAGNGPAFSAYLASNTSISSGTFTKVTFDTEEFDTNSNFASSRFTPTVAGYYQVNTGVAFGWASITRAILAIYKNGSQYKIGNDLGGSNITNALMTSAVIYMNGSTDYLEVYGYSAGTTLSFYGAAGGTQYTWFNGAMIRSA